jgi:lambda family phage portal protein
MKLPHWFSFKRATAPVPAPANRKGASLYQRRFSAAVSSRVNKFVFGWMRINQDLQSGGPALIMHSRELAKNCDTVAGYLDCMTRNVIGAQGFRLQCRAKDPETNARLESLWDEYQSRSAGAVTLDGMQSGRDFDILVLRTLLIDGEVFIRRVYDPSSRFGMRYEVLDTLDVDYTYNEFSFRNGEMIRCGIRVDEHWRPISYFIRKNTTDQSYQSGERIEYPAKDIIHLYRKFYPNQVRGITPLAAVAISINQAASYREAELVAARMQACNMAFYVKQQSGADILEGEVDDKGDYLSEMSPGQIAFAPEGYGLQQLANNHPNANFGGFLKAVLRGACNALGISYNKCTGDYESVNYSSLREAALEDRSAWTELQSFLIENWKDLQYSDWIKAQLLFNLNTLDFKLADEYSLHKFFGRTWDWVDPAKDIAAIASAIALGLTDHITEIEKRGGDVDETLAREALYLKKRAALGLPLNPTLPTFPPEIPIATNANEDINHANTGN